MQPCPDLYINNMASDVCAITTTGSTKDHAPTPQYMVVQGHQHITKKLDLHQLTAESTFSPKLRSRHDGCDVMTSKIMLIVFQQHRA
jgi:hypothetical protein